MVQIDGSPHAWFEDRGPECCLIVYIDDATGALLNLRFYPSETTQAYMESTKRHIHKYGKPLAYYSDRHMIFKSPKMGADTQLGRALKALDIELICANSPQAKGRVERANKMLQDRLVKELRLHHISDIESANKFLECYADQLNEKFAQSPSNTADAHRPLNACSRTLELILCAQEIRTVSTALELSYKNTKLQLPKGKHRLKGAKIRVCELYSGQLVLLDGDQELEYTQFEHTGGPSVETDKTINAKVDGLAKRRKSSDWKPASNHPWRSAAKQAEKSACLG